MEKFTAVGLSALHNPAGDRRRKQTYKMAQKVIQEYGECKDVERSYRDNVSIGSNRSNSIGSDIDVKILR